MTRRFYLAVLLPLICLTLIIPVFKPGFPVAMKAEAPDASREPEQTWLIQWHGDPVEAFYEESHVIRSYPDQRLFVATPRGDREAWLRRWSESPDVSFVEPNQQARMAKLANDPLQANQRYLQLIHAEQAWDVVTENDAITIAIVDTGVDYDHPDLKTNLVPGVNLINPGSPPLDDNGHGTNVAGVIGAVSNNDKGTTGLLWRTRLMPIKALDSDGNGDEDRLGEGIRYAVDHGANIVVLSLGLNKYSSYMESIVEYAETRGVLLVAASGNEGKAVKYPAAYPTVLAVGGAAADGLPDDRSNYGPELDVIAPWDVFTTEPGGKYEYRDGTSLAAPQVAAVCAMVWAKHPDMTPRQLRNQIRQTADRKATDWTPRAGFGLLRADRAVTEPYRADLFEPNDSKESARTLPLRKTSEASFTDGTDVDGYVLQAPYAGTVHLKVGMEFAASRLRLTVNDDDGGTSTYVFTPGADDEPRFSVPKGNTYIRLQPEGAMPEGAVYQITPEYTVYRDPFEDNDRQFKATVLPARIQTITGTFDHPNDADWYVLTVPENGVLRVKMDVDTTRMDPVLSIQRRGTRALVFDQRGDGGQEESFALDVTPGDYYIKAANLDDYAVYPVIGEYELLVDYVADASDPYEPNDKSYQSTDLSIDSSYNGILENVADTDWYRFRLTAPAWVTAEFDAFSDGNELSLSLLTMSLAVVQEQTTSSGQLRLESELPAGTYYVKITGIPVARPQPYELRMKADTIVAGYRDIAGHWAQAAIESLSEKAVLEGYEDHRFQPDRNMTRAEVVAALTRAIVLPTAPSAATYADVSSDHWAFDAIMRASMGGIVDGYPDGQFRPGRSVSRMEMAAMIGRALGLKGSSTGDEPFNDTPDSFWGTPLLREMKALGLIDGYEDGSFDPSRNATRAEFAAALANALQRGAR